MLGKEIYTVVLLSCILAVQSLPYESSLGIVGGDTVDISEVPYMARYRALNSRFACGATIIHHKFLITTARCHDLMGWRWASYVMVGSNKEDRAGQAYEVKYGIVPREYYRTKLRSYDFALLKLYNSLRLYKTIKAIPLAKKDFVVPDGAMFDVIGFGSVSENLDNMKIPDQLQKATVPYISYVKCKGVVEDMTENLICAGGDKKGSCYFDEGGPVVYNGTLLGVISFENSCGRNDHLSVFVSIPAIRDFIDEYVHEE